MRESPVAVDTCCPACRRPLADDMQRRLGACYSCLGITPSKAAQMAVGDGITSDGN